MAEPALRVTWLPLRAQRILPWRNGGGSTREVAIEPEGATVDTGFVWRISVASVAAFGPFSRFPGVDRSLWLLRGRGLELDLEGRVVRLDQRLQRFDFPGEWSIQARLVDGPNEYLNVMVAREVPVAAAVHSLQEGAGWRATLPIGQHLLLLLAGAARIVVGAAEARTWSAGDAVRMDGGGDREITATAASCDFLCATFARR